MSAMSGAAVVKTVTIQGINAKQNSTTVVAHTGLKPPALSMKHNNA